MLVFIFFGEIEFEAVASYNFMAPAGGFGYCRGWVIETVANEKTFVFGRQCCNHRIIMAITESEGEQFLVTQTPGELSPSESEITLYHQGGYHFK